MYFKTAFHNDKTASIADREVKPDTKQIKSNIIVTNRYIYYAKQHICMQRVVYVCVCVGVCACSWLNVKISYKVYIYIIVYHADYIYYCIRSVCKCVCVSELEEKYKHAYCRYIYKQYWKLSGVVRIYG